MDQNASELVRNTLFNLSRTQLNTAIATWMQHADVPSDTNRLTRLCFWAQMQILTWWVSGLFDIIPYAGRYSKAASSHTLQHPEYPQRATFDKIAIIFDAMDVFVRHFTPVNALFTKGIDLRSFLPETSPTLSDGASTLNGFDQWLYGLIMEQLGIGQITDNGTFLIGGAASTVIVVQTANTVVSTPPPQVLEISEGEASRFLGLSRKALANRRREKKIPRNLYRQEGINHRVSYSVEAIEAYIKDKYTPPKQRLKK